MRTFARRQLVRFARYLRDLEFEQWAEPHLEHERKTEMIKVRVSAEEKAHMYELARQSGQTFSEWIRSRALAAARAEE